MPFLCRALLTLCLVAPLTAFSQREKLPPDDLEFVNKTWPNAKVTSTGLRYVMLEEGKGDLAKPGDKVSVNYAGWLLDGTMFDKAMDEKKPIQFRLGRSLVIEGWDQAIQLMKPGGHCVFIVPSELAYGTRGHPPSIPGDATLVFEVYLRSAQK